jgi:hypothetical protein
MSALKEGRQLEVALEHQGKHIGEEEEHSCLICLLHSGHPPSNSKVDDPNNQVERLLGERRVEEKAAMLAKKEQEMLVSCQQQGAVMRERSRDWDRRSTSECLSLHWDGFRQFW